MQQHHTEAAEGEKQQQPQQQPDEDQHDMRQPQVQVQRLLRPQRQTASVHRRAPETAEADEVQDLLQQQQ